MSAIRAAVLLSALLGNACADSPLSPSTSLAGTWSGRFEQLQCTTTAVDPRTCGHNRVGDVTLVFESEGPALSGHVLFRSDQTGSPVVSTLNNAPLSVSGSFSPPNVALTGSHLAPLMNGGTYIGTLGDWMTTLTAERLLNGTATWTQTSTSKFGTVTSVRVYQLTGLRRIAR